MNESKKKIKNDILFIVAVALIIGAIAGIMFIFREEGTIVEVSVDGKLYGTYSLNKNQTIEIRSGDKYNILVIKDGKAYVSEANCPHGDTYFNKCTNKKPIKYTGESILCKENRVVIEIKGDNGDTKNPAPDFGV